MSNPAPHRWSLRRVACAAGVVGALTLGLAACGGSSGPVVDVQASDASVRGGSATMTVGVTDRSSSALQGVAGTISRHTGDTTTLVPMLVGKVVVLMPVTSHRWDGARNVSSPDCPVTGTAVQFGDLAPGQTRSCTVTYTAKSGEGDATVSVVAQRHDAKGRVVEQSLTTTDHSRTGFDEKGL